MAAKTTPMMVQFLELKAQAEGCLLFYRMGDFFELFFDDARKAASILDIALTSRGEHDGEPIPMCGVPVHSAEGYLARLIKGGYRVAIAEQVETPEQAKDRARQAGTAVSKALVKRDIVRFVTAGTLTEEALLEPRRSNLLVALAEVRGAIGVASCDISTGAMVLEECAPEAIGATLARLQASECVAPEGWMHGPEQELDDLTLRPKSDFASDDGAKHLAAIHGVATLDGFGDFSRAMLAAAGGLIGYLDHVGRGTLPLLLPPVMRSAGQTMLMDEATRTSLEILTAQSGGREGSLIAAVDRCVTGAGARLLAEDLAAPLLNVGAVEARLSLVHWLHNDPISRAELRETMRAVPDLGRALGRLVAGRGTPRDIGQVRDGLRDARRIGEFLGNLPDHPALIGELLPRLRGHSALIDLLERALVPAPPTERQNGGYIAEGYDAALDDLRSTSGNARRAIAAMEARYREDTGISALKIKHNGVLGYFIEVPSKHADALMAQDSGFTHRQTMAGAVRFNSIALHEEATRIAEAGGHALAAEESHFEDLVAQVCKVSEPIASTAAALARIDVAAGQAERAAEGGWCRPDIEDSASLAIEGGRHPVVEAALAQSGDRFVANDCKLTGHDRLWLIGGAQYGRQIDLPASERIDLVTGTSRRFLSRHSVRGLVWWTACSAVLVRQITSRVAAQPLWSRWSKPRLSCHKRANAALSYWMKSGAAHQPMTGWLWHGRWWRPSIPTSPVAACSQRIIMSLPAWLRVARLCRSTMSAHANGRAIWSCSMNWPKARRIAAMDWRLPGWQASLRRW